MSSSRKLLRLLSLICGILLIVASPFFIFHTEETEYPYPYYSGNTRGIKPPQGIVYYNYNSYYVFFGMLLLAAGIVLIVASYYRHGEANNLATVLFRQNVVARELPFPDCNLYQNPYFWLARAAATYFTLKPELFLLMNYGHLC